MKNDVAVIIILLIICFMVIPLISQLFVKEGFYNMNSIEVNRVLKSLKGPNGTSEFNAEAITKNKDRIRLKDVSDFMLTKEDRPNQDVSYNFCIGKLTCDSGYEMKRLPFKDNDNTNLYYPYCVSGELLKEIRCEGGLLGVTREGETFDASGFTPSYSFNRYQTSENPFYFTQYNLNESKTGRVKAKDLLECDYNRDSKRKLDCASLENDSRAGAPPPSSNPLESALLAWFTAQSAGGTSSQTSNSTSSSSSSGSSDPIKCIADFGTEKGESLCCGQTGVLQSTKYVCPNTLPYCSDFKCGSKFGTCRK